MQSFLCTGPHNKFLFYQARSAGLGHQVSSPGVPRNTSNRVHVEHDQMRGCDLATLKNSDVWSLMPPAGAIPALASNTYLP
jgi:hypothetical protein